MDIKFRAWDSNKKQYDSRPIIRDGLYLEVSYGELLGTNSDIILEQYTGLKDKNRKEIYEGDIVSGNNSILVHEGPVSYKDGCFIVDCDMGPYVWCLENLEIIGNIHEDTPS